MIAKVRGATILGVEGFLIDIEVDISRGLPGFEIVGLPDVAVRESRQRVRAAMNNSGFGFPLQRLTVNLAPADLRKSGPAFDLAIALGIMAACGTLEADLLEGVLVLGELSLDGSVRGVAGVLPMLLAAAEAGVPRALVPADNEEEAALVDQIEVGIVRHLVDAAAMLEGRSKFITPRPRDFDLETAVNSDLSEVRGQLTAKRALEIAAAGRHSLLLMGPPGCGKTLLARCLPGILPPLSFAEALEVAQIYSVAQGGRTPLRLSRSRPFRSPHHSSTVAGLIGGGANPEPGEITLAHHGVLFLDEVGEFRRTVLDVLRQPLEDGRVSLVRHGYSITYPARCQLILAANPCPCGFLGSSVKDCLCTGGELASYRRRLSGPLLDRIDLQVWMDGLQAHEFYSSAEPSAVVRERVMKAWEYLKAVDQGEAAIEVSKGAQGVLARAVEKFKLSARAVTRIQRVARTIAVLEGSREIDAHHLAEALTYRLSL
ncbi:MAG: YifB family Mg chelatase-like AAA ATPase [Firmicutes bacterium]|nr:YifB family Mg chelatase-like AAA ATPase [Bacillota bacterium]